MADNAATALLEKWKVRVRRHQLAHRFAAKALGRLNLFLGIPAVVLSTVVGTSVFASLQIDATGTQKIIVGLLSVTSAILSALQTFLKVDKIAEKHQMTDAKYAHVKEQIEQKLAFLKSSDSGLEEFCDKIRENMDAISKDVPLVHERYWKAARSLLSRKNVNGGTSPHNI